MEITNATKPPVPDFREGVIFQQYIAFSPVRQGNSRGFPPPVSIQGRVRAPYGMPFGLCVGAHFARPPAALRGGTLWGPSCGWDGGGRPLIRHGIRRDTFPPVGGGKALGAALEAAPMGFGLCVGARFARPLAALRGGTLWGPSCGWDGGGRPLIRHGIRRDTFPPVGGGKALGAALEAAPMGFGLCVGARFARPLAALRGGTLWGPSCGWDGGRKTPHPSRHAPRHLPPGGGKALGAALEAAPTGCLRPLHAPAARHRSGNGRQGPPPV